jgi:protein-L-isoaspartate(D-aspartate) O-methyltransferase
VTESRRDALIQTLADLGVGDPRILSAMAAVPRELFVPATFQDHAYDNTALPIGHGQTVSQPQIVAAMTAALEVTDRMKVLEIGTGSGYQTAVLAALARRVYSIERLKPLLDIAEARLKSLDVANVTLRAGDGGLGWPEQAPFDRIMVTAAADGDVPQTLLDQVKIGGVLVAPISLGQIDQRLVKMVRHEAGFEIVDLGAVRFVPLVSDRTEDGPSRILPPTLARLAKRR